MPVIVFASIAVAGYAIGSFLQWRALRSDGATDTARAVTAVAVVAHAVACVLQIATPQGYDFGIFVVASAVNCVAVLLVLLFSLRRPIANLLLLTSPPALITLLLSVPTASTGPFPTHVEVRHVVPSLLAYSVLFIAACQAVVLALQERRLRTSRSLLGLKVLPPLQVMENLLFDLLWVGLVLLSIAIVTGLLFLDDMFAQRVVHHAVLSMSSWVVFAILLWGRYTLGWRGSTAIRWTLAGFATLALAYFGSKAVIELVLAPR